MGLLAHRGLRHNARENSIEAFKGVAHAAKNDIPIGVEFDVRRTADEVLVVNHDPDCNGIILAENSYAQLLQELGEECPPLLTEALAILGAHVALVDAELKEAGYTEQALTVVRAEVADDKLLMSSFLPEVVMECKQLAPTVSAGLLFDNLDPQWQWSNSPTIIADALLEATEAVNAEVLIPHFTLLSEALFEGAQKRGLQIATYTVNDHELLFSLNESGKVEWICTDIPELIHPQLLYI